MARSHHRKKHKEHLRSYQQNKGTLSKPKKGKVTGIFTVLGAATGFAIGFFASGSTIWLVLGVAIGGAIGYFIGHKLDQQAEK